MTPSGLTATLCRLQDQLDGAVAILTGRKIDEVDRLLDPLKLVAAGVHGGEMRFELNGQIEVASGLVPGPLVAAVEELAHSVPGVTVEQKGIAIAVHYRTVPEMEAVLATKLHGLLATHPNRLVLSRGRRVFELVPSNVTKGTALTQIMATPRFRARRPLMIGDDLPDEPAFATAARFGGLGLKVKGEHFQGDGIHFRSPDHVRRWLQDLAETLVQ